MHHAPNTCKHCSTKLKRSYDLYGSIVQEEQLILLHYGDGSKSHPYHFILLYLMNTIDFQTYFYELLRHSSDWNVLFYNITVERGGTRPTSLLDMRDRLLRTTDNRPVVAATSRNYVDYFAFSQKRCSWFLRKPTHITRIASKFRVSGYQPFLRGNSHGFEELSVIYAGWWPNQTESLNKYWRFYGFSLAWGH